MLALDARRPARVARRARLGDAGAPVSVSRAVFLDRDGVLVETKVLDGVPRPATSVDELELLPGVGEACARLHDTGFLLIVVTNQPDVARGSLTTEAVEAMHLELAQALPLDDIAVCMHDDADGCDCRKPQPGMLLAAARRFGIDLAASFLVGDRWRDVEAAQRAGCRAALRRPRLRRNAHHAAGRDCARPRRSSRLDPAAVGLTESAGPHAPAEVDPCADTACGCGNRATGCTNRSGCARGPCPRGS